MIQKTTFLKAAQRMKWRQEGKWLVAQSFVGTSFDTPMLTADVDGIAPARILDAILKTGKNIKFYQFRYCMDFV